jgi:hypothetical protein
MKFKTIFLAVLFLNCIYVFSQEKPSCLKDSYFFYREILSRGANLNEIGINDTKIIESKKERQFEYFILLATCCTKNLKTDSVLIDNLFFESSIEKVKTPFIISSNSGNIELIKKSHKKLFRIKIQQQNKNINRSNFNQQITLIGTIKNKVFKIVRDADPLQSLAAQ